MTEEGAYLVARAMARCTEDGDCLIWDGATNARGPVLTHKQVQYSLRRLVWEDKFKKPFPADRLASVSCGHKACLAHVVARTRAIVNSLSAKQFGALKGRAAALAVRAKSKLSQEAVRAIRIDERRAEEVAAEHGITAAYVYMLRRGEFRRDYSSPFAGLGARP